MARHERLAFRTAYRSSPYLCCYLTDPSTDRCESIGILRPEANIRTLD